MRKQVTCYRVQLVRCANGERLPTLLCPNGVPDLEATLWATTSLRSQNLASATIEQALRSLIILKLVLQDRKVNLAERLRAGTYLDLSDVEAIANAAKRPIEALEKEIAARAHELPSPRLPQRAKIVQLHRSASLNSDKNSVSADTAAIRIGYIRKFITWKINREILEHHEKNRANLIALRELIDSELHNKTTEPHGKTLVAIRQGLTSAQHKSLIIATAPNSTQTTSTNPLIKLRNELVIHLLLELGIRRSELLGLRVNDFDPRQQEVRILRRPDDKSDPRLHEPNTKTRERLLPLSKALFDKINSYLKLRHLKVKGRHSFLIISVSGKPLSISETNRIFQKLSRLTGITPLSPHTLRHTHFEELAEELNESNHSTEQQIRIIRQQGGWSEHSDSPYRYMTRFINNQTRKASITIQEKINLKHSKEIIK